MKPESLLWLTLLAFLEIDLSMRYLQFQATSAEEFQQLSDRGLRRKLNNDESFADRCGKVAWLGSFWNDLEVWKIV